MSSPIYAYHPDMPEGCPLDGAEPAGTIYKAVSNFPATATDFESDIETNKSGAKPNRCKNWGCSVWQSIEAAEHGRATYAHFRESYIVMGNLAPADGEVLTTPSKKQPQHSTFWKVHQVDISGKFTMVLEPEPREGDDPFGPET